MLTGLHYTSPDILGLERERLFSRIWIFAGFNTFLQQRNQYIARRIAGVPVVIQRTREGLLAYLNECPHRMMPIQEEGFGTRSMVCAYHGWSFDEQGCLHGLPNPGLYHFTDTQKQAIRLRRFAVKEVGKLVFVCLSPEPVEFDSQFDPALQAELRRVSEHLDDQIIYSKFPVKYNWKLNMENVKDWNHVQFLHPKTFFPAMDRKGGPSVPPVEGDLYHAGRADLADLSYPTVTPVKLLPNWFESLVERFGDEEYYYNWLLYPNVNFCSIRGMHFLLQQYDPVSPGQTDYHLWMMTARRKEATTDFTALLRDIFLKERNVIEEDAIFLERMQSSLGEWSALPRQGTYELPLIRQHRWYIDTVLDGVRPS